MTRRVAVIGAGIGGLTAALALQRFGVSVDIYEQSAQLGEVGAGITLHPNATKVLTFLGLGAALAARGVAVDNTAIKHFQTGQVLVETRKGAEWVRRTGVNMYQIHRADLHDDLVAAVRRNDSACIKLGRDLIGFENSDSGVLLRFAGGKEERAAVLIGADGIKSIVRAKAFSPVLPVFTGRIAWRGLIPRERLADDVIWPGSGFFIGPDRTFGWYRVRGGALINFVDTALRAGWAEEGWSIPADPAEVAEEFADWHADVRAIIAATPRAACFKWALFTHAPLERWHDRRVAVLGDAAHPMLPFMGQGAAQAIEDAVILARCLSAEGDWSDALGRYERARKERATFVQRESQAKAERWESNRTDQYGPNSHRNEDTLGIMIAGDGPIIGTVAALRPEKAINRLIQAFAIIVSRGTVARLAIVGDGAERLSLERLVQNLGLQRHVTFLGHRDKPEVVLTALDVFALSSDTEHMPLTVLEAMASGLPIAGVDVGDVKHMVAEENRPFIGPVDHNALASSIAALLDSTDLRRRIGAANRARARAEYDVDRMLATYDRLFSGVA